MIATPALGPALRSAIDQLLAYCRENNWAGWDPYDALNSRFFRATPLRHSALARLVWTQLFKCSPVNFRRLVRVPKAENPKALAVFASAAIRLERLGLVEGGLGKSLIARMTELRSAGFVELCWGYPFDWQNRHFLVAGHQPNIICTTFGGNALLDAYENYGVAPYLEGASSAADFIRTRLNRSGDGASFCFSYTTVDRGQVHNANLLGAAFLARVWRHTGGEPLRREALAAARFSVERQRADGSWAYGEASNQQWVDGFHTGYNLVALKGLADVTGADWVVDSLERGLAYYLNHFFESDGRVKYFHDRTYPIDTHAIGQALITLCTLAEYDSRTLELAGTVCNWALENMRSPEGWFYYQKWPLWTNHINYMRWSQAWMLLGLSCHMEALNNKLLPPHRTD
jgi:hypothetical protein